VTDPQQADLHDSSVSVSIAPAADGWEVTVLFARRPSTAIDGNEVDVELLDAQARAMRLAERPTGPLVEAGGSLTTTANAVFRFAGSAPPSAVVVRWAGEEARFRLAEGV
jgi:hypothetical protein